MANQTYSNRGLAEFTQRSVVGTDGDPEKRRLVLSGIRTGVTLGWEMILSTKPQDRKNEIKSLNEVITLASDTVQSDAIDGLGSKLSKMEWAMSARQLRGVLAVENGRIIREAVALIYENKDLIAEADGLSESDERAKYIKATATEQRSNLYRLEIIFDRREREGRRLLPSNGIRELFRRDRMFAMAGSRERR